MSESFSLVPRRNPNGKTERTERWGADSEHGTLRDVLLCKPDYLKRNEINQTAKQAQRRGLTWDQARAQAEWKEMEAVYKHCDVNVHYVENHPDLELQVYTRDTSMVTPWGAVITHMSNPRRRAEFHRSLRFYESIDCPIYDFINYGTYESGDFLMLEPGLLLQGYNGVRTQEGSAKEVQSWFEQEGWEVWLGDIDDHIVHIDVMVAIVAPKLAALCLGLMDPELVKRFKDRGYEIIDVPVADTLQLGCNVMSLGKDRVLSSTSSKTLNEQLKAHGLEVFAPDLSMYSTCGGGVHCSSMHLKRDPA